jgi:hypothetical protein
MEIALVLIIIVLIVALTIVTFVARGLKKRLDISHEQFQRAIGQLGQKYGKLEFIKGKCQVNYSKNAVNRTKVYAFEFSGIEDLYEKLSKHTEAYHVALYLDNYKDWF